MKNDNPNLYTVIMAGGIGSRFWPLSRTDFPKQFHDILGTGRTLLQMTYDRVKQVCREENIIVVTNARYKDLVLNQLPAMNADRVLLEPYMRNTAPCIAYATFRTMEENPDAVFLVAPSDHLILDQGEFNDVVGLAVARTMLTGELITLGIKPTRPDTGYGYIQFTDHKTKSLDSRVKKAKTFTEKPDLPLAERFLESGDFYWNAGIFVWTGKAILAAFDKYHHDMYASFAEGKSAYGKPSEALFLEQTFSTCESISIDFGIMEKADNVSVVLSDFGWSDLGTWGSLHAQMKRDENDNAINAKQVITYDARGNIINMPPDVLAVVRGLENFIVVQSKGVLLICPKSDEQRIRDIVNDIRIEKGEKFV
jgi:mannose-1-phosphate guanylyltransferase